MNTGRPRQPGPRPARHPARAKTTTRHAPRTQRSVRHPRTPAPETRDSGSRQRILAAATAEFAARGFDGTTVDRIAARARLNKAMIYYHFHSKRALYTCVLRDIFTLMSERLASVARDDDKPADKMDRFVATFVTEGQHHAHLAPIMLREIAEGGRRLDEETYTAMLRVVRAMSGIVEQGRASGEFDNVDPILLYLTTVWPIVAYLATKPIRSAIARVAHFDASRLDPDRFIRHMQMLNRRALMPAAAGAGPIGDVS